MRNFRANLRLLCLALSGQVNFNTTRFVCGDVVMRHLALFLFSVFLFATSLVADPATAAPSADVYGNPPDYDNPLISPDGKYLAILMPLGENGGVKILNLAGGGNCGVAPSAVKVRNAFWVAADRLMIRVSFFFVPEGLKNTPENQFEIYRYITVNTDCRGAFDVLRDHKDYGRLSGFTYLGAMGDGKNLLFAAGNFRTPGLVTEVTSLKLKRRDRSSFDVYKFDMTTGKSESYQAGTPDTVDWIADGAGNLRIRVDEDDYYRTRVFARIGGSNSWTEVYDSGTVDAAHAIAFVAMSNKPDVAYVVTRNGEDKLASYEFNLTTKSLGRLVYKNPKVDVDNLVTIGVKGEVVGTEYTIDYPAAEYFDRTSAQLLADVSATFPGEHVQIVSMTTDRGKAVALVEGPQNPTGVYYLADMTEPSIGKIGARYVAIGAGDVGKVKSFSYPARDGLNIPAYLILPPASSGKNLPLVVLVHGGPHARNTAGFGGPEERWAQFLASRGYAVLMPQFRGSSGYGSAHVAAGHFQWGLAMQDDLTDGVKYLIGDGTADPSKVCIFGWSYGGYAAMAGITSKPDLYKCGVAGAGVSDLLLFVGDARRRYDELGRAWADDIGSPIADRDRLIATSPIRNVNKAKAPILIIHGNDDTVVPLRQSTMMVDALKAAGKPVEFVGIEGDDHWLSKSSTSKRVMRELEAFLAKHLK